MVRESFLPTIENSIQSFGSFPFRICNASLFYFWLRAGPASGIKETFQILEALSVALIHAWMNLSLDSLLLYRITEIIKQGSLTVSPMSLFSLNFQIRALLKNSLDQYIYFEEYIASGNRIDKS